jgi:hypothetical protein
MPAKMTPAAALTAYLSSIPKYLQSPLWPQLLAAAGRVRGATDAAIILKLMGPASSYGLDFPTSVQFPRDHELHLSSGTEWYWLSCNLEVEGSNGLDRIAVLSAITRNRAISPAVQQQAGWTDLECQVVDSVTTVTVATRSDSLIVRRRPNAQWPVMGGTATFGNEPFMLGCGPDSYTGFMNVLPLVVQIDDGSNMTINLEMNSDLAPENAFFLQGVGGLTPAPLPGRYYSWPQLSVKGSVAVGGKTYQVKGTGWLDHQLMMQSTAEPIAPPPPLPSPPQLGWVQVQHCGSWSWCEFNLDNGDAVTAAGFQVGTIKTELPVSYGFYVKRVPDGWQAIPVSGSMKLDRFIPMLASLSLPTDWSYELMDYLGGGLADIGLLATPWYPDGSYLDGNIAVQLETPVNVALIDRSPQNTNSGRGKALTGVGYCECVDYESLEGYAARALGYLSSQ